MSTTAPPAAAAAATTAATDAAGDDGKDEVKPLTAAELDPLYTYDADYLPRMNKEKPWKKDPKHFTNIKVSCLAAMKMLKHAMQGVDKGKAKGGAPVEVMGLMIGKMVHKGIVVHDALPLPIEGVEYKVVADDPAIFKFQTEYLDLLQERQNEAYVGWYHSHPFDVSNKSHCFMSSMDISTQTPFQIMSPVWTGLVVDPLRSMHKQRPDFGAFKCWPVGSEAKNSLLAPDGTIAPSKDALAQRWGSAPHRYYQLEMEFYMSTLAKRFVDILSKDNVWIKILSSNAVMEPEALEEFPGRVKKATDQLREVSPGTMYSRRGGYRASSKSSKDTHKLTKPACTLALEQAKGHILQITKNVAFNMK